MGFTAGTEDPATAGEHRLGPHAPEPAAGTDHVRAPSRDPRDRAGAQARASSLRGGSAEYIAVPRSADVPFANPFQSGSDYFGNAGMDLKYRLTSNLTLDATINLDFGQVEVGPAVINLTAFETRFEERRPFFIEGAEIFEFGERRRAGPLFAPDREATPRIGAKRGRLRTHALGHNHPGCGEALRKNLERLVHSRARRRHEPGAGILAGLPEHREQA